ncbi:MAG TPA: GTPase ObgE [Planctomycetes bacterium]|nr:GTPase ObgE [Planctomycetota bacterium]
MFKDYAVIYVRAGHGGNGCCSFRREKFVPKGGPDGGDGGRGGAVYLEASEHENTLLSLVRNPHVRAENGQDGRGANCQGRRGKDIVVPVPPGTLVYEKSTHILLRDLKEPGDRVCVARGGYGGWGNLHFAHATNQAPRQANEGAPGEERTLELELKLIADVGLVGLPNAGKSTLVRSVSAAHPRVADYPFTTLQPHPGVVELSGDRRFVMVDVPGLIEGAAEGHGLGHRFLKHLERTRVVVHLVDMAPIDGSDPLDNLRVIDEELSRYSPALAEKPRLTVFSKSDLVPDPEARAAALAGEAGLQPRWISAATGVGVQDLLAECWKLLHPEDS